jgi:hypothetical protein
MKQLPSLAAIVLTLALCACASIGPASAPPHPIFAKVQSTWGAEEQSIYSCNREPHNITFSPDFSTALFKVPKPIPMADGTVRDTIVYKVLKAEGNVLTMFVDGETRKTPSGDPVVWSLVLVDDNRYYWRRTDWSPGAGTSPVVRCKVG